MINNQCTGVNPYDLMIGNYVMYEGLMYPVLAIDSERELAEKGYKGSVTIPQYLPGGVKIFTTKGVWARLLQPIPLTPELLERCGFNQQYNGMFIRTTTSLLHSIGLSQYDDTQWRILINGNYAGIIHLQYLHEFQNLYYSLTKTKLELCKSKNS